ncbi:MAG: endonuclease MutS2 [Campylobacterales bacterium]|nr:endonuclease MutS2 [Campylobacterales bacterium]
MNKNDKLHTLVTQLDLTQHIEEFTSFFARQNSLYMEGDQELHFRYIKALDALEFKAPPKVGDFFDLKERLKKHGVLGFEMIFEIVKVVRYFRYFKNREIEGLIGEWMDKFIIPEAFLEIEKYFRADGKFEENLDETLFGLSKRVQEHKNAIASSLKHMMGSQKLAGYLVDTQVHFINNEDSLLVRGGFNHVLKGAVVGRSTGGFFYVAPDSILKEKEKIRYIEQEREAIFYEYAKSFSSKLQELLPFINFIDKEFSKFDNYQARVLFAKSKNMQILKSKNDAQIVLSGFIHPALHNAKPINVNFSKNILMITGVNAGGKTMLLKSILASAFLAKYIIPMKIDDNKSHIGSFKAISAIIDDPQNVKNDISTFAGRMQEFSKIFEHKSALIGVDEIELGTDSDEAAALFKVILDDLIKRGQKVVVTTHHKRLAALMADRDDVELMAAIYDEEQRRPTYEFMQGIIGKSYAFETALRYGIHNNLVTQAKSVYGDNSEKLSLLIERGSQLERELKEKHRKVDEKIEELRLKELALKEQRESIQRELEEQKFALKRSYEVAISEAKNAAKATDTAAIHRAMNKANQKLPKEEVKILQEPQKFSVGDNVKYHSQRGVIVSMKGDKEAIIEVDGMRVRVKTKQLRHTQAVKAKPQTNLKLTVEKKAGLKCDLHGMRADEACEILDSFLSNALINGWDEVIVYHGIGTGKLSFAVKNFLKAHPKVKKFEDAPPHLGGYGAKIVTL